VFAFALSRNTCGTKPLIDHMPLGITVWLDWLSERRPEGWRKEDEHLTIPLQPFPDIASIIANQP
jgi:hypothetical protein